MWGIKNHVYTQWPQPEKNRVKHIRVFNTFLLFLLIQSCDSSNALNKYALNIKTNFVYGKILIFVCARFLCASTDSGYIGILFNIKSSKALIKILLIILILYSWEVGWMNSLKKYLFLSSWFQLIVRNTQKWPALR